MKLNTLYQGDCLEVLSSKIEPQSVDLIFADPPYNLSGKNLEWKNHKTGGDWYKVNENWDSMSPEDYFRFTNKWVKLCSKVLKDNGSIYVSCTFHNLGEVLISLKEASLKINNIITWQKSNAMPNMTKRVFTHSTEFIVWAVKGKKWKFNYHEIKRMNPDRQKNGDLKQMRDVWLLPLVQGKERIKSTNGRAAHPTQKPIELLKRIIIASSDEGDLVLDPFLGSGTTTYVAKKLNRNWIGVEKEKKYYNIAAERMNG